MRGQRQREGEGDGLRLFERMRSALCCIVLCYVINRCIIRFYAMFCYGSPADFFFYVKYALPYVVSIIFAYLTIYPFIHPLISVVPII